jgi:hypothetical protein
MGVVITPYPETVMKEEDGSVYAEVTLATRNVIVVTEK